LKGQVAKEEKFYRTVPSTTKNNKKEKSRNRERRVLSATMRKLLEVRWQKVAKCRGTKQTLVNRGGGCITEKGLGRLELCLETWRS